MPQVGKMAQQLGTLIPFAGDSLGYRGPTRGFAVILTQGPGERMPSPDLQGHQACTLGA